MKPLDLCFVSCEDDGHEKARPGLGNRKAGLFEVPMKALAHPSGAVNRTFAPFHLQCGREGA